MACNNVLPIYPVGEFYTFGPYPTVGALYEHMVQANPIWAEEYFPLTMDNIGNPCYTSVVDEIRDGFLVDITSTAATGAVYEPICDPEVIYDRWVYPMGTDSAVCLDTSSGGRGFLEFGEFYLLGEVPGVKIQYYVNIRKILMGRTFLTSLERSQITISPTGYSTPGNNSGDCYELADTEITITLSAFNPNVGDLNRVIKVYSENGLIDPQHIIMPTNEGSNVKSFTFQIANSTIADDIIHFQDANGEIQESTILVDNCNKKECLEISGPQIISSPFPVTKNYQISLSSIFRNYFQEDKVVSLSYLGGTYQKDIDFIAPSRVVFQSGKINTDFNIRFLECYESERYILISMVIINEPEIKECNVFKIIIDPCGKPSSSTEVSPPCCNYVPKDYKIWKEEMNCGSFSQKKHYTALPNKMKDL